MDAIGTDGRVSSRADRALDRTIEAAAVSAASPSMWQDVSAAATLVVTPNGGPIRTIITGRRRITTGSYASVKAGRSLPFESMNERAFLMHSEVDASVEDYRAQAIIADRRRGAAVKFARFLADRLDRLSIDTARRAAAAEISRFERRKFMHALLAGAGAAVAVIAKAMGPEAAAWVDPVTLVGAALVSGTTLGLLATLDFVDRLNRILDALNEAEAILVERASPKAVADLGRSTRSGLMALFHAGVRRLAHRADQ